MTADEADWAVRQTELYQQQLDVLVRRLHDLADDVAREGKPRSERGVAGIPPHAWAASQVVHKIQWGLANCNLQGLITQAAEADETLARSAAGESV